MAKLDDIRTALGNIENETDSLHAEINERPFRTK